MDWTSLVLEAIINYGAPMVCGILMVGAMGIPLPGTLVVIAAGAFMRQELLNIYTTSGSSAALVTLRAGRNRKKHLSSAAELPSI